MIIIIVVAVLCITMYLRHLLTFSVVTIFLSSFSRQQTWHITTAERVPPGMGMGVDVQGERTNSR